MNLLAEYKDDSGMSTMDHEESCLPPPAHEHQSLGQRVFLHLNAVSPAIVVFVCLYSFDNLVAAVFAFQFVCMVALPLIYIFGIMKDGAKTYEVLMRRLLRNWKNQVWYAVLGFFSLMLLGFAVYLCIQTVPFLHRSKIVATAEEDGLNSRQFTATTATLFALEFTFVNSLLEELFWRIYLHRELGGHTGVQSSDQTNGQHLSGAASLFPLFSASSASAEASESSLLKDAELHTSTTSGGGGGGGGGGGMGGEGQAELGEQGGVSLFCLPPSEMPKLILCAYYASYHVVVMVFFVQWWLAVLGFFALVALGRIFVFCRESEDLGIVTGWGFHAGVDAAFCLIMLQLYFHFVR